MCPNGENPVFGQIVRQQKTPTVAFHRRRPRVRMVAGPPNTAVGGSSHPTRRSRSDPAKLSDISLKPLFDELGDEMS